MCHEKGPENSGPWRHGLGPDLSSQLAVTMFVFLS
jgi:hypothetical protein